MLALRSRYTELPDTKYKSCIKSALKSSSSILQLISKFITKRRGKNNQLKAANSKPAKLENNSKQSSLSLFIIHLLYWDSPINKQHNQYNTRRAALTGWAAGLRSMEANK